MKHFLATLFLLLALLGLAAAEPAVDITMDCALNGYWGEKSPGNMRDESYKSYWKSVPSSGVHALTVEAPAGQSVGGILIRWRTWPLAAAVQAQNEQGEWVTVAESDADFNAQYIAIPDLQKFRIISRDDNGRTQLQISDITIVTPGELPADFQVWRKPPEKVDLMLIEAHPDDEVLWFGGLLPTYAGVQAKEVLVVNAVFNNYVRRLELLDSLWTCGVENYPVILNYLDVSAYRKADVLKVWGEKTVMTDLTRVLRQYKPDVVVLHAEKGESGHGAHVVLSEYGRKAVLAAADETQYTESAQLYGLWDVPKTYMHLYAENQIQQDWHIPLEHFGGLTSFEVADLAFHCHKSQLGRSWEMKIGGETDNSLFGLWRTTVGPDTEGKDMFENIPAKEEAND